MPELHGSHRWNEQGEVAVCQDCRVEGYDDVPAAFRPCKATKCPATMDSRDTPGHTHRCRGGDIGGIHFCAECGRWFGATA